MYYHSLEIDVEDSIFEQLKKIAEEDDATVEELIEQIISDYIIGLDDGNYLDDEGVDDED